MEENNIEYNQELIRKSNIKLPENLKKGKAISKDTSNKLRTLCKEIDNEMMKKITI